MHQLRHLNLDTFTSCINRRSFVLSGIKTSDAQDHGNSTIYRLLYVHYPMSASNHVHFDLY